MSESFVEQQVPESDENENGAPPSKKIKLESVSDKKDPSESQGGGEETVRPEKKEGDDDDFDPVQAILEASKKCQEEEEERRRNLSEAKSEQKSNNSSKNGTTTDKEKVQNDQSVDDDEEDDGEEGDDAGADDEDEEVKALKSLSKRGKKKSSHLRRNIKDILKPDQLDDLTIAARKEEEERRQRMNLKLQMQQQQLKLLQQQQSQLLRESLTLNNHAAVSGRTPIPNYFSQHRAGKYPQNYFPSSGFGDGDLLRKLIKKKHITVSLDEEGKPKQVPQGEKEDDDCILLSSDEETESKPRSSSSESRPASHKSDQTLHSLLDKQPITRKVHEVIALSSEEEDNAAQNGAPSNRSCFDLFDRALGEDRYGTSGGSASVPTGGDEDDDDCVILSPEPDEEETDEKDECSQDLLYVPDHLGRVLVNVGHPDEDDDVFLPPQIARIIKPHQIGGIRFLYDNVVESRERYKNTLGFGCILAHAMGLGKTLQTVSFCDVFLRTVGKTVLIIVPINTIQNWLNEFNRYLPSRNNDTAMPEQSHRKRGCKAKRELEAVPPNEDSSTNSEKAGNGSGGEESLTLNTSFSATLNLDSGSLQNANSNNSTSSNGESGNNNNVHSMESAEQTAAPSASEEEIGYRNFDVLLLNETVKSLQARERIIRTWASKGGVLLIGYEMYRMLALKKLKKSTKKTMNLMHDERVAEAESLDRIYSCLVDPGPDCVICDEGHRIKNSGAGISQALKAIRTKRRVVLTGYPLQNNLMEYWCMVDFVRPNYLGTKAEFSNMFERPIQNGQCADSTVEDKRLMKFRSHVLHSLLEGFVQRRSHLVLKNALPHKEEWVFLVRLTPIQLKIYKEFIRYLREDLESDNASANPIKAFAVCCKIWNHPDVLYNVVKKNLDLEMDLDIDEVRAVQKAKGAGGGAGAKPKRGSGRPRGRPPLNGVSCLTRPMEPDCASFFGDDLLGLNETTASTKPETISGISLEWAKPLFENYVPEIMENGVKFELLFQLIDETVMAGDKLLVFSQSLLTLDLIELFLKKRLDWRKFSDYVRLDGSTAGLEREKLIQDFNTNSFQKVFLISTRAGSLGINLVGANRVCIFDASWNPCHDSQAVCRVYRYGQTKPCFIYRFVSDCTLEKRIYDRQVSKKGMADRIVDEMNPNTPFKSKDVSSFLVLQHDLLDKLPFIKVDVNLDKFEDPVLKNVLQRIGDKITQEPFEHESLLIDQKHQRLSKSEKRLALKNYEKEKKTVANAYATYQRPSYAQYYPQANSSSSSNAQSSTYSSSYSSRYGDYGSSYGSSGGGGVSSYSSSSHYSSTTKGVSTQILTAAAGIDYPSSSTSRQSGSQGSYDRFELHIPALKSRGITVYPVELKNDTFLKDPNGSHDIYLRAGERVYILVSQKGTYLRVQGKLLRVPFVGTEMTQELAERFVLSLLKTPPSASSSPQRGHGYPVEQKLPPSNNLLYQKNSNHLQITNSRNNSGGDVMMSGGGGDGSPSSSSSWHGRSNGHGHVQHSHREHKSSSSRSPSHHHHGSPGSSSSHSRVGSGYMSDSANSMPLPHLNNLSQTSPSHSELMNLTRLAENVSQLNSPYPVALHQHHHHHSNSNSKQEPSSPVVTPPSDLEVIKLNRAASCGSSSNSNSSNSRTNSPYARQSWSNPPPPTQTESGGSTSGGAGSSHRSRSGSSSRHHNNHNNHNPHPSSTQPQPHHHHHHPSPPPSTSSSSIAPTPDKAWLETLKAMASAAAAASGSGPAAAPSASPFFGQSMWPGFGDFAAAQYAAAAAAALGTSPNFAGLDLTGNPMNSLDISGSATARLASEAEKIRRLNFSADEQSSSHF